MKKFIITETDKNNILKMYGLLKESTDYELLNYANNYIDNNSCNKIYSDLKSFQSAVESGQVQMSSDDKSELNKNLDLMNSYKGIACGTIKSKMKDEFTKQSQENPEKLKTYMCWFSQNITHTSLSSCSSNPVNNVDNSTKVDTPKVDSPKIDTPKLDTPPPSKSLYDRMSTPLEYNKNLRSGNSIQSTNQQRQKISTITNTGTINVEPEEHSIFSTPKK